MGLSQVVGGTFKLLDGFQMPLFGLGTWELFDQKQVDLAVNAALESGYRLFDTANYYRNERELGNAFEKYLPKHGLTRSDVFFETKANISNSRGSVKDTTQAMVENALQLFKTDYLDLVLIHYPKNWSAPDKSGTNRKDRSDAYGVLEQFQKLGKIRSIGVSNFEPIHIDQLVEDGHSRPTVNQCEFHPHMTRPEVVSYCKQHGIFFQAHTSLAKHSRSLQNEAPIKELMNKYKASFEQILLAFAHKQSVGVIPKSGNPQRIAANFKAIHIDLTEDELSKLSALNKFKQYSDCDGWNVQ